MRELRRFLVALGYFTRLPIPAWVGWSVEELDRAARYFALVGAVVGVFCAGVLWLALHWWAVPVAVAVSMLASVMLTGAFHEDGLADSADGFGGGYTAERVLEIMRDSRIGSFGALALVLVLLLKFASLCALADGGWWRAAAALVCAHVLARAAAVYVMRGLPHVRPDAASRAKPVAQAPRAAELVVTVLTVVAVLALAYSAQVFGAASLAAAVLAAFLCAEAARRWFAQRLGGYTGDCLGATQQLAELAVYLALSASWR